MENSQQAQGQRKWRLLFGSNFLLVTIAWLFFSAAFNPSFAHSQSSSDAQRLEKVFVCETCNRQEAISIAHAQAPLAECTFTQEQGQIPTPDDMSCFAAPRVLMVVNPIEQRAYKFRVQVQCHGTWCASGNPTTQELAPTAEELADLAVFYSFHQRFLAALQAQNDFEVVTQPIPLVDWTTHELDVVENYNLSAESCEGHPVQYFTNLNWRNAFHRMLATGISSRFGTRSFEAVVTDKRLNGLSFGKQQVGVSWEYSRNDLWTMYRFSDPWNNRLNFKVSYEGNVSEGPIEPHLVRFILAPGTSAIGGVLVSDLISGAHLSLRSLGDIGCLSLLLNNPEFFEPISHGEPEFVRQNPDNPASPFVERCYKTVKTQSCIVNDDNTRQCLPQTVGFWEMCPVNFP
ncbi:hypothetical protein CWE06_02630 [Aliidiomarina haloalkalitolerans]|uniref:Uncharacterized protein n=2 Tax=Aliidiomarina haloalkalitolerans TaxID=859059 RepID=A0A432VYM9_9GAMM|nr:hypothetical protein CWE06_02630 [Aliidiomarina haloalkalitolerans]